jgi:hypothetical protein
MSIAVAVVTTPNASLYLRQLSKHWSRKFPVDAYPQYAWVQMPSAICELDAGFGALSLRLDAEPEKLGQIQAVIALHLQRVAAREDLKLTWTAA